jgi:hypothetical protein
VAAVPSIYIKVIKAEGIRQHKGRVPTPSMLIRVSVSGQAQPEVLKTKPMPAGSDPLWCAFALPYFAYHLQAAVSAFSCCRVLAGGARGKLKTLAVGANQPLHASRTLRFAVPPPNIRNQEFTLPVPDPTAAQLECTIWDEEDQQVDLLAGIELAWGVLHKKRGN